MSHVRSTLPWLLAITVAANLTGCGAVGPATSDVPCLHPNAWSEEIVAPLVRAAGVHGETLLATGQTDSQLATDRADGLQDYRPHVAVYRLDPSVGVFELVDDAAWDNAGTEVRLVTGGGPFSPIRIEGSFSHRLTLNGSIIPVSGGNPLEVVTSPTRTVAAVLSSAGFTAGFPFVVSGFGTGQHYHQLFSEVDGSPLGDAVKVGIGETLVVGDWTAQEDYVIYWQRESELGTGKTTLCAVPTPEDIAPSDGE